MEHDIYIILGSNLGDKKKCIEKASRRVEDEIGNIVNSSAFYQTSPWGFESENEFLNKVVCVKSDMNADDIMKTLLEIENELGRNRGEGSKAYLSRTIDLDILLIDSMVINSDLLTVPHPRMTLRNFVLYPLAEIAGDFIHPVEGKSIKELLKICIDKESVTKVI